MSVVDWHDVECGSYTADLPLWRELAARESGPVLDVGAGTGRVSLDLARRGHEVTALDVDGDLLAELDRRSGGAVTTVVADAQAFALEECFGLIIVPMQTVQLLADRPAFLARAREHLLPGGVVAAAITDDLEPFEGPLPEPDVRGHLVSQPTAVRVLDDVVRLERRRDDGVAVTEDVIELARLDAPRLCAEAAAVGLAPEPPLQVAQTEDHVGSTVVVLRG